MAWPTTKFVMRKRCGELLPETVYARTGKADASAFVPRAVDVLGGEAALNDLDIACARMGKARSACRCLPSRPTSVRTRR